MPDVLDLAQLNRATLARQGLLERSTAGLVHVVAQAGGLQAQSPQAPAIGLWSRVAGFRSSDLVDAALAGALVRGTSLRGTLHLHTADDYRALRMLVQPQLDRTVRSLGRRLGGVDPEAVLAAGRPLLEDAPRTIGAIKAELAGRFAAAEPQALGNVVRMRLQLLMQPDGEARYGWANVAPFTPATELVGALDAHPDPRLFVRRFLSALGPGTVQDVRAWSGAPGLGDVTRSMLEAGELLEVTTHDGRTLLDLPDAPRPPGDAPAGVRFLPMWDNLLLSHADRSRVIDPAHKPHIANLNGMPPPTYLVDGFVHGTWKVETTRTAARLQLVPFSPVPAAAQEALVHEGEALLAFLHPDLEGRQVRLG
ncbi:MAG: hypothetical protein JWM98_1193 [Thermoleophilia bacterium]|nr:hypothetical protein [Thermoleophilia bacterium]